MNEIENIHYALGEIAYAIAAADGKIQKEERNKFHDIIVAEVHCKDYAFNISDIIFKILERDKLLDSESNYNAAIKVLKTNSHYLSPVLKATILIVAEKIAKAFPPVTEKETNFLSRLKHDIEPLEGDPVFYEPKN